MALKFDGSGYVSGASDKITLNGDFRIDLPSFTLDRVDVIQLLVGSDDGKGWVGVNPAGHLFFQGRQSSVTVVSDVTFSAGTTYSGVYIERIGSTLTCGWGENSLSVSDTGTWAVTYWGYFGSNNPQYRSPWLAEGQGVISGDGITTTTHNFDATSGTVLNDLTGGKNWPLTGFSTGGFTGAEETSVFDSQPKERKIYPRTSKSGGLFNKGQAQASFTFTGGGSLTYRILDEDEVTEVIAAQPFTSGDEVTFNIPANTQWYKIEVLSDGVQVALSNRFGCGGITRMDGQSLVVRAMVRYQGATLDQLGITPTPYHSVFATYIDSKSHTASEWGAFASSGKYNTPMIEYLNKKVEDEEVLWGFCGYAKGGAPIANFISSAPMDSISSEVEGWHEWYYFQGHTDAGNGVTTSSYMESLNQLHSQMMSKSTVPFDVYTTAIPNIDSSSWGSVEERAQIRLAHKSFNESVGGVFINPMDLEMYDGVHQTNEGTLAIAKNLYRATKGTHIGASITGFSRTGAVVTINTDSPSLSAQTPLGNIVSISLISNPYEMLDTASISVNGGDIVLTLSSDPNTDDLIAWYGAVNGLDGSGSILDNYSDSFSSEGRSLNSTIAFDGGNVIYAYDINQPPTVVLGPNQSVSSGATVQLDATQSTAGSHPIASYEWTQTAGDTVTLVNSTTATPEFIAPTENDAQTLTFDVVAIDSEGNRSSAKTVSISVAGFNFEGSILELIDSVSFELVTDGNLMIYPGRANREIIKLRPSSVLGLVVDDEDCIDFDNPLNAISKLEVIIYNTTEKAVIDSEGLAIVFEGSEAHCRFGDFQPKSAKEPFDVAVVVYIENDGRGVVVYSTSEALGTQGGSAINAYVQSSLGV